jgi:hypothetical protein
MEKQSIISVIKASHVSIQILNHHGRCDYNKGKVSSERLAGVLERQTSFLVDNYIDIS